jgi:hypothetical protein
MITEPIVTDKAGVAQWTPVELWMTTSLLVCIALAVLYGLTKAKRAKRNLNTRTRRVSRRAVLS